MKIAVDIIVQKKGTNEILLIRRKFPPHQNMLAFPGGFVEENESFEQAALRELHEETNIVVPITALEHVGNFSEPSRDQRQRVAAIAFACVVPADTIATAGDDAGEVHWFDADGIDDDQLAFDHDEILARWRVWKTTFDSFQRQEIARRTGVEI